MPSPLIQRIPLVALLLTAPVGAAEPLSDNSQSTALLSWRAPEGCPSESDFRARVAAHLGNSAPTARARTMVDATVVTANGGFHTTLRLEQAGRTRKRALDTASCSEALDAAALVVALAIDPSVSSRVSVPSSTPNDAPSARRTVEVTGASAEDCLCPRPAETSVATARAPVVVAASAPTQSLPKAELRQNAATAPVQNQSLPKPETLSASRLHIGIFQLAEANVRRLPGVSLGLGLGAFVDYRELRFALSALTSDGVDRSASGGGEFRLYEGRAQACFLSGTPFRVGPCASMSAGALTAKGFDVDVAERKTTAWLSAGIGVRVGYVPGDTAEIGLHVNAEHPFTRSYFELSGTPLYRPPALGLNVGLAIGLRFR